MSVTDFASCYAFEYVIILKTACSYFNYFLRNPNTADIFVHFAHAPSQYVGPLANAPATRARTTISDILGDVVR